MVRHLEEIEPEERHLRQNAAFVRNRCGKNHVERGETVGGDDEQSISEIIDVADLSARRRSEAGEMRFLDDACHRACSHRKISPQKVGSILAQRSVQGKRRVEEIFGKNCAANDLFFVCLRQAAKRFGFENLFPVCAAFRSAKDDVTVSLRFERDELSDEFVLAVSKQVGMVHETKQLFIRFALGKMNPEELRLELFARLASDEEQVVDEALVVSGVERERTDQAGLRGRREIGAGDIFSPHFGQKSFWNTVLAENFAGEREGRRALLVGCRFAGRYPEIAGLCVGGKSTHLAAKFQGTSVNQARGGRASVLLGDLAFSDGGSAEEEGIFSAGLQVFCREIVRGLRVGEATGLHWRQYGIFHSRYRFDKELTARVFLDG